MSTGTSAHVSVQRDEVLALLQPKRGGRYVDCTTGAGGHAAAILEATGGACRLLAIDTDPAALDLARTRLAEYGDAVQFFHGNYRDLATMLIDHNFLPVDGLLLDLGVSSMQLDQAARGFSFRADGPLDMRMNSQSQDGTAADLVNSLPEGEIANLLFDYGEERHARRIARAIVQRRQRSRFHTTTDLAQVVAGASGGPHRGHDRGQGAQHFIHPATRTFQALRIAVNDELAGLEEALPAAVDALAPGGRLVVISFHSLEDRIVKRFLQSQEGRCSCPPGLPECRCNAKARIRVLTRKPLVASAAEQAANPRSRSAKLRAAEKLQQSEAS